MSCHADVAIFVALAVPLTYAVSFVILLRLTEVMPRSGVTAGMVELVDAPDSKSGGT